MIATGKLKIKIARVLDLDGMPVDEKMEYYIKRLAFLEIMMEILSFSGSNNETASGWKSNIEELKYLEIGKALNYHTLTPM